VSHVLWWLLHHQQHRNCTRGLENPVMPRSLKVESVSAPEPKLDKTEILWFQVMESSTHRLVWVGRDLSRPSSPTPCHGRGHLQPDQGAQSPVPPGLEWFQGWGISHLSGQPEPGSHHPKSYLPVLQNALQQFNSLKFSHCSSSF